MVLEEGQLFHKLEGERDPSLPPVQKSPSHLHGLPTPLARIAPPGPKESPPVFQNVTVDFMFDVRGRHEIVVGLPGVKTRALTVEIKGGRLRVTGDHKDVNGLSRPVAVDVKLPRSVDMSAVPQIERVDNGLIITVPKVAPGA
jgi:HSP20 family molecular chaperone IbpA